MPQLIGKIRHRVTLQSPVLTADGAGAFTRTWQQIATLWAFIKPRSIKGNTKEIIKADQLTTTTTYEIIIRYRNDVTTDMRFIFGNRTFHLLSAYDENGRKQWLNCLCEEREE